jgi:hypothetical protein
MLNERPLTDTDKESLRKIFDSGLDLELVSSVIYFGGWCSYEENGGIFIFRAIDGSIQKAEFGYCVMSENHDNSFTLEELTPEEAIKAIEEMEEMIRFALY